MSRGKWGNRGERKRQNSNNKISVRYWSHLSAPVRVQSGKKTSRLQSNPLIFLLFFYFQRQHRNCSRLQPPHGLAKRLSMGPRSESCWAFVIKHARALYRLMTSLITGNYRSSTAVGGFPSIPKHSVSNVSNDTTTITLPALLNPFVPTLVGVATAKRSQKKCQYYGYI